MNAPFLCIAGMAGLLSAVSAAPSRFEEFTKKFERTTDRAEVLASTYLGGTGTEWLAAGGFQPDGTVLVAGVALGPTLDLGVDATVVGTDGPIQQPARRPMFRNGRTERDKDGNTVMETLTWRHPNATAFIARLSPDARKVLSVTRLGWKTAGLTDAAVDSKGDIYLCGPAGGGAASLSGDSQTLVGSTNYTGRGGCTNVYLAKLNSTGTNCLWVRMISGLSPAPSLTLDANGNIHVQAADVRVFDPAGTLISMAPIPVQLEGEVAVNPRDGTYARAGEHHWATGREPYRDPTLNIYKPDGSLLYELYNWDGPLVGLNALRLVSDSAIRGVAYDGEGNLVIHAWSDGGNSVMFREPNDVFTDAKKFNGLGLSISGAGVLSCSYVIKIDTRSYKVSAGTLWVSYLQDRNKPNSMTINSLGVASDGSVCLGGSSAWGLIRTGNSFKGDPSGSYVAVLSRNLDSLRFSSTLPGTGETEIGKAQQRWGIASGSSGGKFRVMFLSGAETGAPMTNALQEKYGGGMSDGHLLVLDLSPK